MIFTLFHDYLNKENQYWNIKRIEQRNTRVIITIYTEKFFDEIETKQNEKEKGKN